MPTREAIDSEVTRRMNRRKRIPADGLHSRIRFGMIMLFFLTMNGESVVAQHSIVGKSKLVEKKKIAVQVRLSQEKFHPGSTALVLLMVSIQNGWHINSATPSDENSIATTVEIGKVKGIKVAEIRYPKGIERKFAFTDTPLDVYEATIYILIRLNIATGLKSGTYIIPAITGYQACSDNICLAPTTLQVAIPLRVALKDEKVLRINQELFESYEDVREK